MRDRISYATVLGGAILVFAVLTSVAGNLSTALSAIVGAVLAGLLLAGLAALRSANSKQPQRIPVRVRSEYRQRRRRR